MIAVRHKEQAVVFECSGLSLVGIVHGAGSATTGVLVIVGGPQYRVGSHRQFLLLARYLADNNIPVMRFDYRSMGDAGGETRTFEDVGDDIHVAIDAFFNNSPGLQSVILWGLCDAASAALFYGHSDSRVTGMILLNPWVRTETGEAKVYLRHYYIQRLINKEFWQKVLTGKFELRKALVSLLEVINKSCAKQAKSSSANEESGLGASLRERMYEGLDRFQGWVGIVISGDDLTAAEFEDMVKDSKTWQKLLRAKVVEFYYLPDANHTFSKQIWRDQVAKQTYDWIVSNRV